MIDDKLKNFIERAGFNDGWENIESSARRMAREAVKEITNMSKDYKELYEFKISSRNAKIKQLQEENEQLKIKLNAYMAAVRQLNKEI